MRHDEIKSYFSYPRDATPSNKSLLYEDKHKVDIEHKQTTSKEDFVSIFKNIIKKKARDALKS